MKAAIALLQQKLPDVQDWPPGRAEAWLTWLIQKSGVCFVQSGGQIVGIGAARPVKSVDLGASDWYHWKEDGEGLFIELTVGNRRVMEVAWREMVNRFGPRRWVAFRRARHSGDRVRVYDFERLWAKLKETDNHVDFFV